MIQLEKLLIAFLLLSIVSCDHNKKDTYVAPKADTGIQIGLIDTLYSKVLNQERELVIYIPESAKDPKRKRKQYPVVYLLDGDYNFVPFVGMLKHYSEMNDTKILPEMIVVGIPNIDNNSRMMDFSPTTDGKPEQQGGGNKFLEFMETELFPYIEQNYSGSQNRSIIGHSFGGLVVMNALTTHPEMFTNYLLIDGSLYFDDKLFLNNPKYSLKGKDLKNKNLYIGIANTATYGSDLESIKKDTIRANKYVRHSLELVNQIESFDTNLNMKWKYYENDTHGSTAFLSQMDGFRFFYSWFEFKDEYKYRGKSFIPKTIEDHFANLTKSHFELVSKKIGYTFKPEEQWVSGNASMLFNYHKLPKQALENYNLNIEYYPNSSKVYKDLADFYLLQEDTIAAKEYYAKTLELDDNS
ncbi:alpha/beta hydrolase-fold protein [Algibacter sp. L4_22]|uniref:alpha/beta hydrolase-fold protein n=1 Tax=Algibacter sp. L4_22 TaxID=2942477 RepID=UPI00201B622B|nr:alpha/beta hydrolase-fold protein [Algibacter sp. L4_22]MCL5128154.1 alpha/beta hydrolase-fold protein [Algibacter sp. L4_22]